MQPPVVVYSQALEKIGFLENAFNISYEKKLNQLWTACFSLPADDPKAELCSSLNFVEIYDGEERVDIFRIMPVRTNKDFETNIITFDCEHALSTLIDDVLFQYHQTDNESTVTNISYILGNQAVTRWVLDTCSFSYLFSYKWENENLLGALLAIPKPFLDNYLWSWDTTTYPWKLSLLTLPEIGSRADIQIRYKKNLKAVEIVTEPQARCTRLYMLGAGEGELNQVTIASVDDPAKPLGQKYIDMTPDGQTPVSQIFSDKKVEDPEALFAQGQALLQKLSVTKICYTIETADIFSITGQDSDKPLLGQGVTVFDDIGHLVTSRVVSISKGDLTGAPGDISIEISNMAEDIADDFAQLAERTRIYDTYAQGASNIYQIGVTENCDRYTDGESTIIMPLNLRFVLPDDIANLNKIQLWLKLKPYRAYHKETPQSHSHNLSIWNYLPDEDLALYSLAISDRGSWNALVGAPGTPAVATSSSTSISTVSYHIYEQALSSPSVDVYVGTDAQLGSDNSIPDAAYKIGTYTTDQAGLDITAEVPAAGDIYCIRFVPNKAMRIEATLHCRVFVLSNPLD